MSGGPPRARPRAVPPAPRQPYPPADDLEIPVEAEPFPLESQDVPTLRSLSEQIGAVSSHLQVVHQEAALARERATEAADRATDAAAETRACRGDVAELRALVLGDHAPRITQVERSHHSIPPLPPGAKAAGKYGAVALAIPAILQLLAALKPGLAGPIQQIVELFK